jgi:nitronate monooxygenase
MIFSKYITGTEAGGHGSTSGTPLLTLVSSILGAISQNGPPVLAAGGLVNGGHLASLLTLGASGAVFGTRFLLSPESQYSDVQRQALIAARTSDSVHTMAFDYARNTLGWPRGIDGRGLRNGE